MQMIILLRLKIFQSDLTCITFTHGKLPHKDQPHIHAIALEKFLVILNANLRQMWKWHLCFMTFNTAATRT